MTAEVLIIGLNEIGASIGSALSERVQDIVVVGFDQKASLARIAKKAGAINRRAANPEKAARSADVIFLSVPSSEVQSYLEFVGPAMKSGAVLFDTSFLKCAALKWVAEQFTEDRYYIGAIPVVSSSFMHAEQSEPGVANAELLQGGVLALVIPPETPEDIIDLAVGIAELLGTDPVFIDADEIDGMMAAVEGLPALLSLALMHASAGSPGWHEIQLVAGRPFAAITRVGTLFDPKDLGLSLAINRENMLNRLDLMMEELKSVRQLIESEDQEALIEFFKESNKYYQHWLKKHGQTDWTAGEEVRPEVPHPSMFERLLGINMSRGRKDRINH